MNEPEPPARQGFRTDHRTGSRMALHSFDQTLRPPNRNIIKFIPINSNYTTINTSSSIDITYNPFENYLQLYSIQMACYLLACLSLAE